MNNLQNKQVKRMLPYLVEFVKFSAGFAFILMIALVALHFAMAAQ